MLGVYRVSAVDLCISEKLAHLLVENRKEKNARQVDYAANQRQDGRHVRNIKAVETCVSCTTISVLTLTEIKECCGVNVIQLINSDWTRQGSNVPCFCLEPYCNASCNHDTDTHGSQDCARDAGPKYSLSRR